MIYMSNEKEIQNDTFNVTVIPMLIVIVMDKRKKNKKQKTYK